MKILIYRAYASEGMAIGPRYYNSYYYLDMAMDDSLGLIFAAIFFEYLEGKWQYESLTNFKPIFYGRYVDDTFIIFNKQKMTQSNFIIILTINIIA